MPSNSLDISALRTRLADRGSVESNSFNLLQTLCCLQATDIPQNIFQELVLRALEHRDAFGASAKVLNSLARNLGLFPYLDQETLSTADLIALELHRPIGLEDRDIVFHRAQANVYRELLTGRNVVLSAPTSFGKSLLIDAIIATGRFSNVVIIVPTIALIDETRRRLSSFKGRYKIITHSFQKPANRNIYILTQERVLEMKIETVDFFVIDEFYKLSPSETADNGRCALLNQAFYQLRKTGKQFYMLGPGVKGVQPEAAANLDYSYIGVNYETVATQMHKVKIARGSDEISTLSDLCKNLGGPTIIFVSSPKRASDVAKGLIEKGIGGPERTLQSATRWIGENYHPEWHFVKALKQGIGIHHARIPRALGQYVIRKFNDDALPFLICTSTLIEGVNTKAKNIVVLDEKINRRPIDLFTFNNIRGRSGRMFHHFIGHVWLFHEQPQGELPFVDIPVLSQSVNAPESLLIQLDESDLSDSASKRLDQYKQQTWLDYETLRRNVGIDLDSQLALAKELTQNSRTHWRLMNWAGLPSAPQVKKACELIWEFFGGASLGAGSARNVNQLNALINQLRFNYTEKSAIRKMFRFAKNNWDDSVQRVLDFQRLWAGFQFPRLLRAVDRIQADVFARLHLGIGNYELFAVRVENLFLDPTIVALDEYGIPLPLARKLVPFLNPDGDLDAVLSLYRSLNVNDATANPFELEILYDAQRFI